MRRLGKCALVLALMAQAAVADAPETSAFPRLRPDYLASGAAAPAPALAPTVPRPRPRPAGLTAAGAVAPAPVQQANVVHPRPRPDFVVAAAPAAPAPADPRVSAARPRPRPAGLSLQAQEPAVELAAAAPAPVTTKKREKKSARGSVCGDPAIKGEKLAPITSKTRGCGVEEPVRVTSIDGIQFSQPATIDCATAIATRQWIQKGLRPAFGNREVVGLHIFGSYMCRSRNNIRGAKISEHGRGKAIDVAGFVMSDGREWTVKDDYNKQIRKAQKAACGIFGTTLGPGSDGYHEDHLHFDTAHYSYGPYCH